MFIKFVTTHSKFYFCSGLLHNFTHTQIHTHTHTHTYIHIHKHTQMPGIDLSIYFIKQFSPQKFLWAKLMLFLELRFHSLMCRQI